MLRMWKGEDNSFPFNDAHDKTYNVRDGSDWEKDVYKRQELSERIIFISGIILMPMRMWHCSMKN